MKVAILSDIHDQKQHLAKIIDQLQARNITEVIVLGDFCAPPTVRQLVESGLSFRCIYGNNDGDRARMVRVALESQGRVVFADDEFDSFEIDDRKVFITHYPGIAQPAAASGHYDAVFFGHNHQRSHEVLQNGCLLLNPGEVWGWMNGVVSYAVWDTQANTAEIIEVEKAA